jgi:hypothetical protein
MVGNRTQITFLTGYPQKMHRFLRVERVDIRVNGTKVIYIRALMWIHKLISKTVDFANGDHITTQLNAWNSNAIFR